MTLVSESVYDRVEHQVKREDMTKQRRQSRDEHAYEGVLCLRAGDDGFWRRRLRVRGRRLRVCPSAFIPSQGALDASSPRSELKSQGFGTYACFRTQHLLTSFVVYMRCLRRRGRQGHGHTRRVGDDRQEPNPCPCPQRRTTPFALRKTEVLILHGVGYTTVSSNLSASKVNSPLRRLVGDGTFQFSDSKILDAYQITTSER